MVFTFVGSWSWTRAKIERCLKLFSLGSACKTGPSIDGHWTNSCPMYVTECFCLWSQFKHKNGNHHHHHCHHHLHYRHHLALGDNSVRLALRTGGIPLMLVELVCTLASCRLESSFSKQNLNLYSCIINWSGNPCL